MRIEHRPCPRCQVPLTVVFSAGVAVCFNCQATWNPQNPVGTLAPARRRPQAGQAPFPFSVQALARLAVYRDAVRAGFYNEGLEEPALPAQQEAA